MHIYLLLPLITPLSLLVHGAPLFGIGQTESHAAVSTVSAADTDALIAPTRFAAVAYCPLDSIRSWTCKPQCEQLPGVEVLTAGGDGAMIPQFFVAHDPVGSQLVVSHEGTDPTKFLSILNDVKIIQKPLPQKNFPGVSTDIKAHDGFYYTFNVTSQQMFSAVQDGLNTKNVSKVLVVGHSLGAAVGLIDAMFLKQHLPSNVEISTKLFGLPRVGNQAWADFVDSQLKDLTHVTNKEDPVPQVPPQSLDYQQPSGEFHIQEDNSTINCPGQENQDDKCIDAEGLLHNPIDSIGDHLGPYYGGVNMGTQFCSG